MASTESIPFKYPGDVITAKASAQVTGRTFVKITGNRTGGGAGGLSTDVDNVYTAGPCTAGAKALGVAAYDAASSGKFKVWTAGFIAPVTAGANITAGAEVECDAAGKAIPLASGRPCGYAMTGASSGAIAEIKLY